MTRAILPTLAAALACLVASAAQAEGHVAARTLEQMGLSGLMAMSDSDGMTVRGMGFVPVKKPVKAKKQPRSLAVASGQSWATVSLDGKKAEADAGSTNSYLAIGQRFAAGNNFSEAGLSKTITHQVTFPDGTSAVETRISTIRVFAGGNSAATAF
jgi:hypothetical protein